MKLGCIVMASGAGARFRAAGGSGHKLLEPVDGPCGRAPLVVHTAARVPRECFEVAVVTWLDEVADAIELSGLRVPVVRLDVTVQPPRSVTTRAGAAHARDCGWDGVMYLPGDQPLVSRESFCALADAFEADPSRAYRLSWNGEAASPVLFPARCIPALMGLQGRDGGASLLRADPARVALVEALDPTELLDVDVPADIARIEHAWAAKRG